jgi:hypothetical protein
MPKAFIRCKTLYTEYQYHSVPITKSTLRPNKFPTPPFTAKFESLKGALSEASLSEEEEDVEVGFVLVLLVLVACEATGVIAGVVEALPDVEDDEEAGVVVSVKVVFCVVVWPLESVVVKVLIERLVCKTDTVDPGPEMVVVSHSVTE